MSADPRKDLTDTLRILENIDVLLASAQVNGRQQAHALVEAEQYVATSIAQLKKQLAELEAETPKAAVPEAPTTPKPKGPAFPRRKERAS